MFVEFPIELNINYSEDHGCVFISAYNKTLFVAKIEDVRLLPYTTKY